MSRRVRIAVCTAVVLVAALGTVSAETIRITSGAFIYPAPTGEKVITLAGEGFTFTANTSETEAVIWPFTNQCDVPECKVGTTVRLDTNVSGLGLRGGVATYQGTTYEHVGGLGTFDPAMLLSWDGSVVIPAGFTGGTLTAPFTFSGIFTTFAPTDSHRVELFGSGTASLTLIPYRPTDFFPGAFEPTSIRFDFEAADAPPVPEPASLLLLGTGVAGVFAARRRRRA